MTETAYLLFVLAAVAACGDWLGRRPIGRWFGGAILTLILAAALANLGVIPTMSHAPPLYRFLIQVGAPVFIFLLLLDVRLDTLKQAGMPMLTAFGIGAFGTMVGVATAFWLTDASDWLGRHAVVGMLGNAIGTYAGFAMAWFLQAVPSPISTAHAIAPPPEQSVANCTNPTYASDVFVCQDAELLGLDRQVRDALATISIDAAAAPNSFVEDQDAWFKRRSRCAFSERQAGCLRAADSERIVVLDQLRKASPALAQSGARASCSDVPWGSAEIRIKLGDRGPATIMDAEGRVLAVALNAEPRDDWSPFVRFSTDGATIRFSPLDRPSVECRTTPSVRR